VRENDLEAQVISRRRVWLRGKLVWLERVQWRGFDRVHPVEAKPVKDAVGPFLPEQSQSGAAEGKGEHTSLVYRLCWRKQILLVVTGLH
jgi:hypothetical protein